MLGYDDLTQGTAAGDYTKGGYGGSSQAQNKSAGSGPGKGSVCPSFPGLRPRVIVSSLTPPHARLSHNAPGGGGGWSWDQLLWEHLLFLLGVSVSSSTTGLPDMTGSVYNKTQVREEQMGVQVCEGCNPRWSSPLSLCPTDF